MPRLLLSAAALLLAAPALAQVAVPGTANEPALFGFALAYGDFDGDGADDLAVGAPQDGLQTSDLGVEGGSVTVFYLAADGRRTRSAQAIVQGRDGVPNQDEAGDYFGNTLATGDFDGDGFDDLAIGAPFEAIGSVESAGTVLVLYGSPDGITPERAARIDQQFSFIPGAPEADDRFGAALATGDLNGDGFDDLAIGAPGEDIGTVPNAGLVTYVFGSAEGLTSTGVRINTLADTGATADDEPNARFGAALAIGDVTGDGRAELAVGAPSLAVDGADRAGIVVEFLGSDVGPSVAGGVVIHEGDIGAAVAENEQFGFALAYGDFDGDGLADLAIGAPGENAGGEAGVGAVFVLERALRRTDVTGSTAFVQGINARGVSETGDQFGFALATGDVDGDGLDDLAIGGPAEDIGSVGAAGAVFVQFGSGDGLTGAGAQLLVADQPGFASDVGQGDAFGWAVAIGRAGGRGAVAIGAAFSSQGPANEGGVVYLVPATAAGVEGAEAVTVFQGGEVPGVSTASEPGVGDGFALGAPFPNPTAGRATVPVEVSAPGPARVAVVDALGREVAVLWDGPLAAGTHRLALGADLPAGVYVVRAVVGGSAAARRVVVAR